MIIEIKNENAQKLAQLVYLGNIIINGHRNPKEMLNDYDEFAQDIFQQIVKCAPTLETKYKFKYLKSNKTSEVQLTQFTEMICDSVIDFYQEYLRQLTNDFFDDET